MQSLNFQAVCLSSDVVDQRAIDQIHRGGMRVFVYTINTPEVASRMRALGVDMIFSDMPDKVVEG